MQTIREKLLAATAALPFMLAAQNAGAEEPPKKSQKKDHIIITHPVGTPLLGGTKTTTPIDREVDCTKFYRQLSSPDGTPSTTDKLFLTDEAGQQIDVNGQSVAKESLPKKTGNAKADADALALYYGRVTTAWTSHVAEYHGQCQAQYGAFLIRKSKPLPPFLKSDWETRTYCPIQDAYKACKIVLDIK